jgi:hypothetical protein
MMPVRLEIKYRFAISIPEDIADFLLFGIDSAIVNARLSITPPLGTEADEPSGA